MYIVNTENEESHEYESLEEAEKIFESWKDDLMVEGVTAYETYIEIVESTGFDDYNVIKKVIAVIDNDRTELGSPREEGFDWDYWAKWEEVV